MPFVTQKPIVPGESYTYEFTAVNPGSLMYHSHHNATDQVGRGLLGAFIVDPPEPQAAYDREYIWISNDTLGGFTINGHGFPATVPVLAAVGETVLHPVHERGDDDAPVAPPRATRWRSSRATASRSGAPRSRADTLGVNPGERWDVVITADRPGVWAFHCHILSARRGHGRHVRHGQHADRRAREGGRRRGHRGPARLARLCRQPRRAVLPSGGRRSGLRLPDL